MEKYLGFSKLLDSDVAEIRYAFHENETLEFYWAYLGASTSCGERTSPFPRVCPINASRSNESPKTRHNIAARNGRSSSKHSAEGTTR